MTKAKSLKALDAIADVVLRYRPEAEIEASQTATSEAAQARKGEVNAPASLSHGLFLSTLASVMACGSLLRTDSALSYARESCI
jgi:hypothetical protein